MSFPERTYHLSFKKMSRFILFMSNRSKLPPLFLPPAHTVTPSTNLISLLNQDMEETDSNSLLSEDISNHILQLLWRASSAQGSYEPVTFSITLVENALLHKNKQTNQDALEQQKQNIRVILHPGVQDHHRKGTSSGTSFSPSVKACFCILSGACFR